MSKSHFQIGDEVMREEEMDRFNALFFLVAKLDITPEEVHVIRRRLGMDTD